MCVSGTRQSPEPANVPARTNSDVTPQAECAKSSQVPSGVSSSGKRKLGSAMMGKNRAARSWALRSRPINGEDNPIIFMVPVYRGPSNPAAQADSEPPGQDGFWTVESAIRRLTSMTVSPQGSFARIRFRERMASMPIFRRESWTLVRRGTVMFTISESSNTIMDMSSGTVSPWFLRASMQPPATMAVMMSSPSTEARRARRSLAPRNRWRIVSAMATLEES